jgi:CheY-like chemotaxis protein
MAQLFQSFNRLGQEVGEQEGTGIGLVVSKRLVEMMDGRIGVESSVGVGSEFWFEIDTVSAPPTQSAPIPMQLPTMPVSLAEAARHTLLCVEDNPANLMLVEYLLARRTDIQMMSARDGRQGVEMAIAQRPDVILMDVNLPGISGITAMHILAQNPVTSRIPVVALSANAMPHDFEKGRQAGFFRYLTKPIKVPEFMEVLDLALAQADHTRRHP